MKTRITETLGIKYPVIQGGMAWVATYELASAVSEAGGLGIIGAGGAPAEWVRDQIQKCKSKTDKPFGVNLMLMNPEADEIAKIIAEEKVKVVTTGAGNPAKYIEMWKEELIPYYEVDLDGISNNLNKYAKEVVNGLNEWKAMKEKRENGEISDQDYIEWKLNYELENID